MKQLKIEQSITNRAEGSIPKYLHDIGRLELLEADEESRLAEMIRNGDEAALEKMVKANLRFVVSVAKQYQNRGIGLADLISEGNIGLIKAAKRFDATKGFKFISFAVWWIRQAIISSITEQRRIVRLPGNQVVGLSKISKVSSRLEQQLERLPTLAEISEGTELPEEKVADMIANGTMSISLDARANEETEFTLLDKLVNGNVLNPDDELLKMSLLSDVKKLISKLPKREQLVLKYFYGLDGYPVLTLDDIAEIIELSKERTRQLRCKAVNTLNYICVTNKMTDYF